MIGEQVLHAMITHKDEHEVGGLAAELQSPATAGDGNRRGSAPAMRCAATGNTLAVFAPETDGELNHGGDDRDAVSVIDNGVGNRMIRSGHDLGENGRGLVDAFFDIGLVLI